MMNPRGHAFGWICGACSVKGYVFYEDAILCCGGKIIVETQTVLKEYGVE